MLFLRGACYVVLVLVSILLGMCLRDKMIENSKLESKLIDMERVEYFDKINMEILSNAVLQMESKIVSLNETLKINRSNFALTISRYFEAQKVTATAYSPRVEECDDTPFIAASGDSVGDFTIAVSRDFLKNGWKYGDIVYIEEFDEFYKVNDTMNKRFENRIDVFHWVTVEAIKFGKQKLTIYKVTAQEKPFPLGKG